ncbi:MAG: DUF5906 domain-containing protein [Prevotella sp.]|nr:DUF5906 domain-containing protein [Prevotella sp.]
MDKSLKTPIVFVGTDNENTTAVTAILPDGSHVPKTENNIKAIAERFENGSIQSVAISIPQSAEEGYESPIEMVETVDNYDDFMKIAAPNGLLQDVITVPDTQLNALTGTVIGCKYVPAIYTETVQYPVIKSYSSFFPQINLIKAVDPQQTSAIEAKPSPALPEKERFNAAKAAERIMRTTQIVQHNNALYVYQGTYYKLFDMPALYRLIRNKLYDETTRNGKSNYIKDIARFILTDAASVEFAPESVRNKVMFKNCVFNLDSRNIERHSPQNYNLHALSASLVSCSNCDTPVFGKYIYDLANGDPLLIRRIWEVLGLLLCNDTKAKRIVVLAGEGDTGKSVFGDIVKEPIADQNVTSFSPQKLTDRFIGTSLVNSAVNICMDLPSTPIDAATAAMLKSLSGGDTVSGEIKYMSNFTFTYQGQLLFGTNYTLQLNYLDQAFAKRLQIKCVKLPQMKTTLFR